MLTNKSKKITNLIPRFFLALLLIAISLQAAGLLFLAAAPQTAQAKEPLKMNLQVPIPGLPSTITFGNSTEPIAKYIKAIYNYAVGIVGILAAVVMMIGGLMWITAGGNTSNIGEAKTMITASLTGLVLVLTSYLLLSMVNPALVNLQSSVIGNMDAIDPTPDNYKKICEWANVDYALEIGTFVKGNIISKDSSCEGAEKELDPLKKSAIFVCFCRYDRKPPNNNCSWQDECNKGKNAAFSLNKDDDYKALEYCGSKGASFALKCCCPLSAGGNGSCAEVTYGPCSSANMGIFGNEAAHASAICKGESGGIADVKSGTDICLDANGKKTDSVSIGLFQINLSSHKLETTDGILDCKNAFSAEYTSKNHYCKVENRELYNNCVEAASNPEINIENARRIYKIRGWNSWGYYLTNCKNTF